MAVTTRGGLPTLVPARKIGVGTLVGAVVTLACWALDAAGIVAVPPEVAGALVVTLTFAAGWLVPPAADEGVAAGLADPQRPATVP